MLEKPFLHINEETLALSHLRGQFGSQVDICGAGTGGRAPGPSGALVSLCGGGGGGLWARCSLSWRRAINSAFLKQE